VSESSAGFVGLGTMGFPMALNLHKAGLLAAVWNRSVEKADRFARATGCSRCVDLAEIAKSCQIIMLCVSGDEDVLEIVDRLRPHLQVNSLLIDCSTVSSSTAREAATRLTEKGAGFIDCPVSGGTEGASNGTLSLMMGGSAEDVERATPFFEAIGTTISHMGPVGAGQATKATNQIMVAGINQAVSEAIAFGQAHDLQIEKLISALDGGAASNWFLSHRGPNMASGEYPLGFKVALHAKDLRICRDMAASFNTRLPIVEMTLLHYERMMQNTTAEEDISSLFRLKSALFADTGRE
jgi:3-hydroxyisobutyrate dehydrogenase